MGWSRKAKFGIHSGRTLRNCPSRKYNPFGYNNNNQKSCGEFAVVKEFFQIYEQPPDNINDSHNKLDELIGFDDGIPCNSQPSRRRGGYPSSPVMHSMNKHKRWLLPELVKESIERNHVELQLQGGKTQEKSSKQARKTLESGQKQSDEVRVTVVERHASGFVPRTIPDCFSVTSNEPSSNVAVRFATKNHSHVGDLKPKIGEEHSLLYYEFLSPFPQKAWPNNRQLACCAKWGSEVVGSKSRNKCKGRRNKHYRHGIPLDDQEIYYPLPKDIPKVNPTKNDSNRLHTPKLFPIGAYIHNKIIIKKTPEKKRKYSCPHNSYKPISSTEKYGKGDAIYVENKDSQHSASHTCESDSNTLLGNPDKLLENLNISPNIKADIQLLVEDIKPDNLIQDFGDNYYEGNISPRKFIIKTDFGKLSPNVSPNSTDCSLLFEISEKSPIGKACGQVSISLPKTGLLNETFTENIQIELNRFSLCGGPLSVKSVVGFTAEQCAQESTRRQANCHISVKKQKSSKVNDIPIKFIQDLCQQKPEVCGVKIAFQHSTVGVAVKKFNRKYEMQDEYLQEDDSYCGVCLSNVDKLHKSGLTRLLQCSHIFCNECWQHYIATCIQSGHGYVLCPNLNCTTLVSEPLVWASTNSYLYQRYCKLHYEYAINTNPRLRSCPTPECGHLAFVPSATMKPHTSLPIHCRCGEVWCFQCEGVAHWPASCEEAHMFRKKHGDFEEFRKSLLEEGRITSVQVKRCPFCRHPISKNAGCQHMSCRCGNEFCWECLSPWDNHVFPCDKDVKPPEEVELSDVNGHARYNKYCKVSHFNVQERSYKKTSACLKVIKATRNIENSHRLVSDNESTSCSRVVRTYVKYGISRHVEAIFHFKYLAHTVLENTAVAMAVAKHTKMVGRLDRNMHTLAFVLDRFNEVLLDPIILANEENLEKVCELLKSGKRLIKTLHKLTQANRKIN